MDETIRKDRQRRAQRILDDLADTPNRADLLRAYVQRLSDVDKLPAVKRLFDEGKIDIHELRELFLDAFRDVNDPSLTLREIVDVFRFIYRETGLLFYEKDIRPQGPMVLYRAATPEGARGISWSQRLESAERFMAPGKRIYQIAAPLENEWFGYFGQNGEHEVFVDPDLIEEPVERTCLQE